MTCGCPSTRTPFCCGFSACASLTLMPRLSAFAAGGMVPFLWAHAARRRTVAAYAHYRMENPMLVQGVTLDTVLPIISTGFAQVLPRRTTRGYTVLFLRPRFIDLDRFSLVDVTRATIFITERVRHLRTVGGAVALTRAWS